MRDFKKYITGLLFLVFAVSMQAQVASIQELTPFQLQKFAKNSIRAGDKLTAIYYYERYREIKPNNSKVNYELANLHRDVRNYEQALELYQQVVKRASNKYPLSQFYYAQMLKSTGKYDEAIEEFDQFRRSYKGSKDSRSYSKLARNEVEGCDSAKKIIQNPLNINIENLNNTVNSPHIELSPIPIDDNNFIYASLRVDSLIYFTDQMVDSVFPVRQFYMAHKEGMDWIGGELLPGSINIPGVETGNGVLSRDGRRFYFTRCVENWQGKVICSIYRSILVGNRWSEPEKLPAIINDPNYTTTQPALGRTAQSDREIIFFVSDRSEGKGGLDIWYTVWNEKRDAYSKPRNLGSRINTPGDEMTPFYDLSTRNMYFSSTGLPGIGGLDVFSAFGERTKWTEIQNVGYPINSSYDDLYFTVSKGGGDGFFVSNRPDSLDPQTCCDDIFYYSRNDYVRITVTGTIYPFEKDRFGRKRDLSGFDFMNPDASIKPLTGAKMALYKLDNELNEFVFIDRYTTAEDGKYYFNLQPNEEYEFKMEGFQYFDEKNYMSTEFFNFSDTIEMPPTWVNVLTDKPIVLENVYYDFNSAELSQRAKNVLDTTLLVLLKEAPEFIIEIGSHTDSVGDAQYNLELSHERANNVVQHLISKGIPAGRLVPKGYGSTMPVAPNYLPDGSDNPQGREKNRRTEFRIVGSIGGEDEDEEYIYD
ncbi:MAG: OmpA family protein [Bacteroidales bacterium]|nr:OmpA family protein [Bacteroidales bacterium]MBN2817763.1 OmpA family protein [Bacteroidales bacterium]